ncbi:MAG: hypothetical protein RLO12_06850, partial [Fulvivirga sp.]
MASYLLVLPAIFAFHSQEHAHQQESDKQITHEASKISAKCSICDYYLKKQTETSEKASSLYFNLPEEAFDILFIVRS